MKILRALGLGIFLATVLLFMPAVFAELSKTLIIFLKSAQQSFAAAGILASYASHLPPPR
ncbi:hypothetical protein KGM48_02420 [Patescibacteria group bacterium]|nr:hypothetical protein [Patescibacteria group bacterium]